MAKRKYLTLTLEGIPVLWGHASLTREQIMSGPRYSAGSVEHYPIESRGFAEWCLAHWHANGFTQVTLTETEH